MARGNPADIPNPFAFGQPDPSARRRRPFLAAIRFLVVVAVALSMTLFVGSQSRRWLVHRLTSDFETLTAAEKCQRLGQLSDLGIPAIKPIVLAIIDSDEAVARTAYDLLRQSQTEWTVLTRSQIAERHREMIDAIEGIHARVPEDRTGWISSLAQQSISESVDRRDKASMELYTASLNIIDHLSLSNRSETNSLVQADDTSNAPNRLASVSRPLPVSTLDSVEIENGPDRNDQAGLGLNNLRAEHPTTVESASPKLYRSSASPLRPVGPHDVVVLRAIQEKPRADDSQVGSDQDLRRVAKSVPETQQPTADGSKLRPVSRLVDSPMEAYDTRSVIYWLGHSNDALRLAAADELQRRGMSAEAITIATRIAGGDVATKIELIDSLARDRSIDPRPWLMLLLRDPSRDVKLRTISVLATMKDPEIERELREHETNEPDPTVAFRIRRVLEMR